MLIERKHAIDAASRFLERAIGIPLSNRDQKRAISMMTEYLARVFNVESDEVAFLVLDRQGVNLSFVAPQYLSEMNANFPYDRLRSIAGRSLWDRRVRIDNRFYAVNHLAYFERARRPGKGAAQIDKMLTYPIYNGTSPVGVIQISRKRTPQLPERLDFTLQDLKYIQAIEKSVLRCMLGLRSEGANSHRHLAAVS